MNEYLRAFVIGSCFFIVFPYFFIAFNFLGKKFPYAKYTFVAPVALGLFNVLSLVIAKQFNLTIQQRYLAISLIAPAIVSLFVYTVNFYNYTTTYEWVQYIIKIYAVYFFIFNGIAYLLDKNI